MENDRTGIEILVPQDDLILVDRSFSRGDVVKRNPVDAQSGMVIGSSAACKLRPCLRISQEKPDHIQTVSIPIKAPAIPDVDSRNFLPYRIWDLGDTVIYQDWVGTIKDIHESVTVLLVNGDIVVINDIDTQNVKELVCDPVGSSSAYGPMRGSRNTSKDGFRFIVPPTFWAGQRLGITKQLLLQSHLLQGSHNASHQLGLVLRVHCTEIEVAWRQPKQNGTGTNIQPEPATCLPASLLESGAVTLYNHARCPMSLNTPDTSRSYQVVHGCTTAGESVIIAGTERIETICKGLGINWHTRDLASAFNLGSSFGSDILVLRIVSTTSTVKVQWQDRSITDEVSTSICPYTEVDEYDVWPGEIVSLKDQEDSHYHAGFEKFLRTRMVGVVQSVNASERVARIRWSEGADITIAGEHHNEVVWPHSTLGKLTDCFTDNSLYEVAAYPALGRRMGDTVFITGADDFDLPWIPRSQVPSEVSPIIPDNMYFDRGANWFGEIVELTLDGQIVVRLGALENVHDVVCSYSNIVVAASADDSTTDSNVSAMDTTSSREITGLRSSLWRDTGSTTIEYNGPTPSDVDDYQWTTDSNADDSSSHGSHNIEDKALAPNTAVDAHGDSIKDPHKFLVRSRSRELLSSDLGSEPSAFEILDGFGPDTDFDLDGGTASRSNEWHRAVFREHKILRSSLPEGVYARTWESSVDIVRVLVVGPSGTPYALAPFLFDIKLHNQFPNEAPNVFFHSWTNGIGRVNPNLYEDGKVCLSLLGTWHSDVDNETWVAGQSSVLQIIVSLLGLVLVKEPFYSEYSLCQFTCPYATEHLVPCCGGQKDAYERPGLWIFEETLKFKASCTLNRSLHTPRFRTKTKS